MELDHGPHLSERAHSHREIARRIGSRVDMREAVAEEPGVILKAPAASRGTCEQAFQFGRSVYRL
ncbi:hypothetical protein ASF59_00045 [Methylobacterium sp. Leaf121]|nr:hypothetical protein ASF59_00045 [Methylobacterium sp. Leaf121]